MSDRLLERYSGRRPPLDNGAEAISDADGSEDFGSFGWLRGARERAVMLELRRKNGSIFALAYGFIDRMEFSPEEGITLRSGQGTIKVRGRSLNVEIRPQISLFHGLTRHRVMWIRETDASSVLSARKGSVVVEGFEFRGMKDDV